MELLKMYHSVQNQIPEEHFILIDYDLYFDEIRGCCKGFVIDDPEALEQVKLFVSRLKNKISDIIVYVCAYGGSITNAKGEEILYADSFYLYTKTDLNFISDLFEDSNLREIEPSAIFPLSDAQEDYFQEKIFLFKTTGDIVDLREEVDEIFMKDMKCIYWD